MPASEIAAFRRETVPFLRRLHEEAWTYDRWVEGALGGVDFVGLAKENLSPIDVIFALLGLVTAFRLGAGGSPPAAVPRGPLPRQEPPQPGSLQGPQG